MVKGADPEGVRARRPDRAADGSVLERLDTLEEGDRAEALLADLDALRDLPASTFEACEHIPGQMSSTALLRYGLVDYSAPAAHAHKKATIKSYVAITAGVERASAAKPRCGTVSVALSAAATTT